MPSPYTDHAGVFKNKLGCISSEQLRADEYALVAIRADEFLTGQVDLGVRGYGLARLSAIHGHLFQDVYDWAGKIRTVPSSKRADFGLTSRFLEPGDIEVSWQELEKRTTAFLSTEALTIEERSNSLAEIFIQANKIHAFPEGNGRSLQVFMKDLAKEKYVELDYAKILPNEWNRASALSGVHGRFFEHTHFIQSPSNTEPIHKIFDIMAQDSRALAVEKFPEALACAKFPELRTAYAGLRMIEERVMEKYGGDTQRVTSYMHEVRLAFVQRLSQGESVHRAVSPDKTQARATQPER